MILKNFDFDKAVKHYNSIMMGACCEHVTIGTDYSENTDGWNIRDMVAECDYWLSCYYEGGNAREEMRRGDEDDRKAWRSDTGKLSRFIEAYKPFIEDYECTKGHCSKFDYKDSSLEVEAFDVSKDDNTSGVLFVRMVSAEVCDLLEDLLNKHDLKVPSEDREGEEDEARIFGEVYSDLEADVTDVLAEACSIVKDNPGVVINEDEVDELMPVSAGNELYVRGFAIKICGLFEELLDENDITIPCENREGEEDEARIFGDVYYDLEDNVTGILVGLCEEVKCTSDIMINVEDYNGVEYEDFEIQPGVDEVIADATSRSAQQSISKGEIEREI